MNIPHSTVTALASRRRSLGLTQTTVGHSMGTTQSAVSEIENGADLRLSTLARYAAALGAVLVATAEDGASDADATPAG